MRTNEQLQSLFDQAVSDMKAAGIRVPLERLTSIRYNAPMERCWGKCQYYHIDFGMWRCQISFSRALCQNGTDTAFKRTAAHELIHLCHPGAGHGWQFKHEAEIMRKAYPDQYDITRCTGSEKVFENPDDIMRAYKYVITCPKCNHRWGYNRVSQIIRTPASYHCRECKCGLERLK